MGREFSAHPNLKMQDYYTLKVLLDSSNRITNIDFRSKDTEEKCTHTQAGLSKGKTPIVISVGDRGTAYFLWSLLVNYWTSRQPVHKTHLEGFESFTEK